MISSAKTTSAPIPVRLSFAETEQSASQNFTRGYAHVHLGHKETLWCPVRRWAVKPAMIVLPTSSAITGVGPAEERSACLSAPEAHALKVPDVKPPTTGKFVPASTLSRAMATLPALSVSTKALCLL